MTILNTRPNTSTTSATSDAGRQHLADRVIDLLNRHSIDALRISLGIVFVVFGALKFVPGLSPAETLSERTIDALTLGIVSGDYARVLTALTETFIGLTLVSGRFLRAGLAVLGMALVGIMSPLVLFAGDMFPEGPTLTAQYVMKDIVLVTAGLVVTAHSLGSRLVRR